MSDDTRESDDACASPRVDSEGTESRGAELRRLLKERRVTESSLRSKVLILVATVGLFVIALGLTSSPHQILVLVGVLLLHEAGHALGMRMFGYKDVRMFFIPFLGAAVSGKARGVEAWKQAVVFLLGPLPGAFLGLGFLALFHTILPERWLMDIGVVLVAVNLFNLLPVVPLDGGRLMGVLLYSRFDFLESVITTLGGILLGVFGFITKDYFLAVFGYLAVLVGMSSFGSRSLVKRLPRPRSNDLESIPNEVLEEIEIWTMREHANASEQTRLSVIEQVVDMLTTRPPSPAATVTLSALYLSPMILATLGWARLQGLL